MFLTNTLQLKIGAALSYVQTAVSVIISLVYTPVMLSTLGQAEYGLYSIAATIVSYVNLLNMGFSSSYIKFYARDKASGDNVALARTNGLFCIVFIIIGLIALLAGGVLTSSAELIFSSGLTAAEYITVRKIMIILTIGSAIDLATSIFSSIIIAHERFVVHKLIYLLKTILSPMLIWIFLLNGYRSVMMALVTVVFSLIADAFYTIYCFKCLHIEVDMRHPSKAQLKEISAFSGFIALTSFVDQINWSIDKLLLGRMWGATYTAVYSVGAQINNLYMQLSTAVSNVFIPHINRLVAEKKEPRELSATFIKIGRIQTLVLLPVLIGFIFLGKPFILLWASSIYDEAYYIAMLLMIPAFVPYIQNIGIAIQMAENKHRFRSLLYTAMSIINLIVSIFLCKEYGAIGCAVGTAVSMIVANVLIMNIYYHKALHLDMISFWKSIAQFVPAVAISSFVGYCATSFISIHSWGRFIICATMIVITYLIAAWFTAMNKSEKAIIQSALSKLKAKKAR